MPEGKAPPIGRLRNFAEVFEWRDTPQVGGVNAVPAYLPVGKCWCSLKARGDMFIGAAQIVEQTGARGTHIVRTRFREDLTTRHMLEIAGLRYRVVSVRPDDARRFVELEVELYGDALVIGVPPTLPRTGWDQANDVPQSIWDGGASEPWDQGVIP
jgi:head-tail adaptor